MDQGERIPRATNENASTKDNHTSQQEHKHLPRQSEWPSHIKFMTDYVYHPSIDGETLALVQGKRRRKCEQQEQDEYSRSHKRDQKQDKDSGHNTQGHDEENDEKDEEERTEQELSYDTIPIGHAIPGIPEDQNVSSSSSSSLYRVQLITSPENHPVLGSYGLFACKTIRPGTHLLDYISLVAPDAAADPESDHTLYLQFDLNLDASIQGNHGRFINDFRGIRTQEQGPNVAWDLYRDATTGQLRMACKVLKRIRKGEEILCTYGKAYWKSRGIVVKGPEWEDSWDTDLEDMDDEDD
ncbi:hypothetical protein BGZ94_000122 [Podila epigama]|nr:hypothetical protein BGZ94_000122 [Podila epigama]